MPDVACTADDWAIVVGIRRYPELGDLNGPENDARAFHEWVTSPAGGAVSKNQAKLLLSSGFPPPVIPRDALPSDREVHALFEMLDDIAVQNQENGKGLQVGRRLYLFPGHGCAPKFEESAILMANATRRRVYHIPGKPSADWFYRSGYFREIALFMDCCREPYENVVLHLPSWIDLTLPDIVDKSRRFYGFGTKWSRRAREKEFPDNSGTYRGVFTLALLDGLRGAAYDAATAFPNPSTGGSKAFVTAVSLGELSL